MQIIITISFAHNILTGSKYIIEGQQVFGLDYVGIKLSMLDFIIFAVVLLVFLIVAVIYLYPVSHIW